MGSPNIIMDFATTSTAKKIHQISHSQSLGALVNSSNPSTWGLWPFELLKLLNLCPSRKVGSARFARHWTRPLLNFPAHFELTPCDTSASLWKHFLEIRPRRTFRSDFGFLRFEILEHHCYFETAHAVPKMSDFLFSRTIRSDSVQTLQRTSNQLSTTHLRGWK